MSPPPGQAREEIAPGPVYLKHTREIDSWHKDLVVGPLKAWRAFSKAVFAEGALSEKTKQLIAVAVAHVTQCPYCVEGHTDGANRAGATPQEVMEAIRVAAEMPAGGTYAHSTLALHKLQAHCAMRGRDDAD